MLHAIPEAGLFEDAAQSRLRSVDGASETVEEPFHPQGYVQGASLGPLQDVVIGVALLADLGGQAVKALRAILGARESHVGDLRG